MRRLNRTGLGFAGVLILVGVVLLLLRQDAQDGAPANEPGSSAPQRPPGLLVPSQTTEDPPQPAPAQPQAPPETAPKTAPKTGGGMITGSVVNALGDRIARVQVNANGRGLEFTDPSGNFKIQIPKPGTYTLRAHVGGWFEGTAQQVVTTDDDGVARDVQLVFPLEGTLQGRALLPNGEPAVGVVIKVTTTTNKDLGRFSEMHWNSFDARSWLAARTDKEGRFGFAALDPRSAYVLWWKSDAGELVQHADTVLGGQTDVLVEVERHRLVLDVVDKTSYFNDLDPYVTIVDGTQTHGPMLLSRARYGLQRDWEESDWVAPAGRALRIVLLHPGHALVDQTYTMQAAVGEQRVQVPMFGHKEAARLRFEARDAQGHAIAHKGFTFDYVDEDGSVVTALWPKMRQVDGVWETRLPPCRVRIGTGGTTRALDWSDPGILQLPSHQTLDVPARGEVWVQLDSVLGGAFVLHFLEPKKRGAYQGAFFLESALRGPGGNVVPVSWFDPGRVPQDKTNTLTTAGQRRSQALPVGRYELTLWPSFKGHELKRITQTIDIEAGKVTLLPIQLIHQPLRRR